MKIAHYTLVALFLASTALSAMEPETLIPHYDAVNRQAVLQGNCEIEDYLLKSWIEEIKPDYFNPESIFQHIAKDSIPGENRSSRRNFRKREVNYDEVNYRKVNYYINLVEVHFEPGHLMAMSQCCMSSLLLSGLLSTRQPNASMTLLLPASLSLAALLNHRNKTRGRPCDTTRSWIKDIIALPTIMSFWSITGIFNNINSLAFPPTQGSADAITHLGNNSWNPILATIFGYSAYHLSGKPSLVCGLIAAGQIGMFGNVIKNNAETIKTYFKFKKQKKK